jgi:hypothetical protein
MSKVIIGFVGTACLTIFIVICYYLLDCIPLDDRLGMRRLPNPVDDSFLTFIWKWKKARPQLSERRKKALETGVLMYSDLQRLTSISILLAGFSQLGCGISSYHWQIMVYSAYFASVTHLTTLTAMRHYFGRDNPNARTVRVVLMLCTSALLTVALVPTGSPAWLYLWPTDNDTVAVPAICFFTRTFDGLNVRAYGYQEPRTTAPQALSFALTVVVLWTSFAARLFKLYPSLSDKAREFLRTWPGIQLKKLIKWSMSSKYASKIPMVHDILSVQLVLSRACFDFYDSMLWEVSTCTI